MTLCRLGATGCKLWLDTSRASVAIVHAFEDACSSYYENSSNNKRSQQAKNGSKSSDWGREKTGPAALHRTSPISFAKAIKNFAELEGMKQAHLRFVEH